MSLSVNLNTFVNTFIYLCMLVNIISLHVYIIFMLKITFKSSILISWCAALRKVELNFDLTNIIENLFFHSGYHEVRVFKSCQKSFYLSEFVLS